MQGSIRLGSLRCVALVCTLVGTEAGKRRLHELNPNMLEPKLSLSMLILAMVMVSQFQVQIMADQCGPQTSSMPTSDGSRVSELWVAQGSKNIQLVPKQSAWMVSGCFRKSLGFWIHLVVNLFGCDSHVLENGPEVLICRGPRCLVKIVWLKYDHAQHRS